MQYLEQGTPQWRDILDKTERLAYSVDNLYAWIYISFLFTTCL